jgi:hypothetical protein
MPIEAIAIPNMTPTPSAKQLILCRFSAAWATNKAGIGMTFDSYCQGYFLFWFRPPLGTIHHPEKIGFNPTHAIETKFAAEIPIRRRKMTDRRAISLINDN